MWTNIILSLWSAALIMYGVRIMLVADQEESNTVRNIANSVAFFLFFLGVFFVVILCT